MDDDYTIADVASLGWVRNLVGFDGARDTGRLRRFSTASLPGSTAAWRDPAVQRGLEIPKRP